MNIFSPRYCDDDNPKTVKRIYQWDDRTIEISLCDQHKHDPDFSHFESEVAI